MKSRSFIGRSVALAAGVLALAPAASHAAFISEYFNDYGTASSDLLGKNGGSGWAGAWAGDAIPDYIPNVQPGYSAAGYSGAGNQADADDGSAHGGGTGNLAFRTFAGLNGTVWISAQTLQTALSSDILFWLDKTNTTTTGVDREFVALRSTTLASPANNTTPEPVISYNAVDDGANNTDFALNAPHLLLLRIDMNAGGGVNDRVRMWVDPVLSGGEAGLGTPAYDKATADAYGATFDGIGVSGTNASAVLDAIRISDEANGFDFVTTGAVPEPGIVGIAGVVGAGLLARRRRRD